MGATGFVLMYSWIWMRMQISPGRYWPDDDSVAGRFVPSFPVDAIGAEPITGRWRSHLILGYWIRAGTRFLLLLLSLLLESIEQMKRFLVSRIQRQAALEQTHRLTCLFRLPVTFQSIRINHFSVDLITVITVIITTITADEDELELISSQRLVAKFRCWILQSIALFHDKSPNSQIARAI